MDIDHLLPDKAVRWTNPRSDGYGKFEYDSAVEIDCWWEWKQEWYRDNAGTQKLSNAVIMTTVPVKPGERLMKGKLSNFDSSSSAEYGGGVWEVNLSEEEKDIEGKTVGYRVTI